MESTSAVGWASSFEKREGEVWQQLICNQYLSSQKKVEKKIQQQTFGY